MKIIIAFLIFFTSATVHAQTPYTISPDPKTGGKVYKGVINKYTLQNDNSFTWYASGQSGYIPELKIVNAFAAAKDSIHFILFGGSWCDDTQYILPKFFKIHLHAWRKNVS
jgi:hypothetical protein